MYKQNLHTHSTFCDGKNTPEEMVQEAIARGFDSLGFSMHSYMSCSCLEGVTLEKVETYKKEIRRLKEAFQDQLEIFLGIEFDFYADCSHEEYDYSIVSVHYLQTAEGIQCFDMDLARTQDFIKRYFGGNAMEFARAYYERLAMAPSLGKFDILGHFDLITKNNETGKFLDTGSKEYLGYALDAVHALAGKVPLFEVNTGAIARGYRTAPYPQMEILKELRAAGFGAVISSDCHNKQFLDCGFEDARELLRAAGFDSRFVLTKQGFQDVGL